MVRWRKHLLCLFLIPIWVVFVLYVQVHYTSQNGPKIQVQLNQPETTTTRSTIRAVSTGDNAYVNNLVNLTIKPRLNPSCDETLDPYPYNLCDTESKPEIRLTTFKMAKPHLLTLFTTMKSKPIKNFIYLNTIRLWSMLRPEVQPVLFLNSEKGNEVFIEEACDLGWDIMVAPRCNSFGYPLLKTMFTMMKNYSQGEFHGYANGDIVFDEGLVSTVKYLSSILDKFPNHLMVGRRKNYLMHLNETIDSFEQLRNVSHGLPFYMPIAIDYFISGKNALPWNDTPPFVIGVGGFDQWLVSAANNPKTEYAAIDSSRSVLAVHQQIRGMRTEHSTVVKGRKYNFKWLHAKGIGIGLGTISAIKNRIMKDPDGTLKMNSIVPRWQKKGNKNKNKNNKQKNKNKNNKENPVTTTTLKPPL